MIVGPGQSLSLQFPDIQGEEHQEVIDGNLRLYFVAWITYEDVLSDPPVIRQTQLSRKYEADAEGGAAFHWMPTHNCADGDCPP
jgi:hypothetical protein